MSFKGNHYTFHNCIEARDIIKDFLVACGWQLVGPTDTEPHRIAQDDKHARILGWFLQSNGEDGNKDLNFHLSTGYDYADRGHTWWYDWLESGITDVQTDNIPLLDATALGAGWVVEINGEQILIGSVDTSGGGGPGDPHYLNGCTRGYGGTTAVAHDAGDVVSALGNGGTNYLRLYIDNYVYRDLVNAIAESDDSGGIGWTIGQTSNADPITGLDGYDSGGRTFKNTCLIKAVGGAEDGKMRWVTNDDGAGRLTWTKFKTAPGPVNCEILSNGWGLASGSRMQQSGGSYYDYLSSSPYGFQTHQTAPGTKDMWLYGSKDGFAMVYKAGTVYRIYYYGAYVPYANPIYKATTGDVAAGAVTIPVGVGNTDLFAVGGKYRIVTQDYRDWRENWDRSTDTSLGASPGDWPHLEGDEMVQECVVVQSVDDVGGTITVELPLIYSYRAGAVIGEDPRPIMSQCNRNGSSSYREQFRDGTNYTGARIPFHAADKSRYRISNPCHRRRDRCHDSDTTWDPWNMDGGRNYWGGQDQCRMMMGPWSTVEDNEEHYTDKLLLKPISIGFYDDYPRYTYGSENRAFGVVPFVYKMGSSLGANDEDTVKAPWDGSMETFRIFYDDGAGGWFCVGPELWP